MIWLVGNRGMLGTELAEVLADLGLDFEGSDREVDIRDPGALRAYAGGKGFTWIVNCSAYTNVDRAEEEEELARGINAEGAANLADVAEEIGAKFVHISTDYVFRGDGPRPYVEADPTDPAGAYGRTKAEGERLVAAACARHFIIRTAWLYGKHGPNFVYTMLKYMRVKDSLNVVDDQHGTPTWARGLALAIARIVGTGSEQYGIYHYTDEGQTTWHGFAVEIERLGRDLGILDRPCAVRAITSDQYPSKVKRPAWSVLCKDKIRSRLGVETPDWRQSLAMFLSEVSAWPGLADRIKS